MMKIDKYEKIGKAKYRLYLDTGEVIDTYDEVILKNDLLLKKELNNIDYAKVMSETSLVEGYYLAIKYIEVRVRSVKEIKDYLLRKKYAKEDIDVIVDRLLHNKLLDDNHFTECFIKDKLNFTNMGQYKIINELKKYGISQEIINKYYYLFDREIMISKIDKLIDKQIQSNKKYDKYKLRNKIYQYLMNQGYVSDEIVECLNKKF